MSEKHPRILGFRLSLVAFLSLALSCQRTPTKPDAPLVDSPSTGAAATAVAPLGPAVAVTSATPPNEPKAKPIFAKPLTSSGENSEARFSPDGTRLIFVSRARPLHKQAQVYELHLELMKEKRVTFHDGDDSGPLYMPDPSHLLFASTTDAIKEPPYVAQKLLKNYNPKAYEENIKQNPYDTLFGSDIYEQQLNGRSIERLTRTPGFDGDPDSDNKGRRVVFSSARGESGNYTHLYMLVSRNQIRLTEGAVIDRRPRFSPDGREIVFSRRPGEKTTEDQAHLMLAEGAFNKPHEFTTGTSIDTDPSWNPAGDEVIFSSNRGGKNMNLFTIDRKGECIRRITEGDFDQMQPAFSPDGKRIVFTGERDGHSNIFIMDYHRPTSCFTTQTLTAATPTPRPTAVPTPKASPMPTPAASPIPTSTASPAPSPEPSSQPSSMASPGPAATSSPQPQ